MKALIRQYPTNARAKENEEVWFEPWPAGTGENGEPYTLDGYRYALAQDAPLDAIPSDFDITEERVPDPNAPAEEDGTAEVPTIVRRIAVLNQERYNARLAGEAQEPAGAPEAPQAEEVPAEVPAEPAEAESDAPAEDPEPEQPADDSNEEVTINGVTYTKAQLRAIMGEE